MESDDVIFAGRRGKSSTNFPVGAMFRHEQSEKEADMIRQDPISPDRVRKIRGTFAFVEHRFLRNGFFQTLSHLEMVLYFFLVLVSNRDGISYYAYDKICLLLKITVDDYIIARNALIDKDLIAFDGYLFQVLSLPENPPCAGKPLTEQKDMEKYDPATFIRNVERHWGKP